MSHLTYFAYPGVGERNRDQYGYNQAVRVGDKIECAGQGGWDPKTGDISPDITTQIDQAFANVDMNLKHAGGKGWDQVFRVTSYHVNLTDEATAATVRNLGKWMPDHKPVWTLLGVAKLGEAAMMVEIDVSAHVPGEGR